MTRSLEKMFMEFQQAHTQAYAPAQVSESRSLWNPSADGCKSYAGVQVYACKAGTVEAYAHDGRTCYKLVPARECRASEVELKRSYQRFTESLVFVNEHELETVFERLLEYGSFAHFVRTQEGKGVRLTRRKFPPKRGRR